MSNQKKNFQNDVDMSADPLDMSLNLISSSETFNFDVRAHQGLNLDTECSFNEFMPPQGVADESVFVPGQSQHESGQPRDSVFDCNIKNEILRDESYQPQTHVIPGPPKIPGPPTGNTGSNIYQIPNEPKTDVRTAGPSKAVQGAQVVQQRPVLTGGQKIVQAPIQIEPQPSEEEIKAKKEAEKAAKKGKSKISDQNFRIFFKIF